MQGKNLQLGVRLVDYNVSIGPSQCVGKDLTDNVLRCGPPIQEPPLNNKSNDICARQKLNPVMVSVD